MRVLVVEDEVIVRQDLILYLREAGHTVDDAANGRMALERMRRQLPDVILLDLRMPIMKFNAERLKDPTFAKVPLILISANGHDARARLVGAVTILDKPVNPAALLAELALLARDRG